MNQHEIQLHSQKIVRSSTLVVPENGQLNAVDALRRGLLFQPIISV